MIIFRADGNKSIGSGHIMRCLSIANTAKELGYKCKFIISSDDFKDFIIKNGHLVEVLNSDYTVLYSDEIIRNIKLFKPSAVIVDSYYISEEFMEAVHKQCSRLGCKLIYIDDRCSVAFSCDNLINYNISAETELYKQLYNGKNLPSLLLGTSYAPLRKEFQNCEPRRISSEARNILVSTGGSDPEHFTSVLVDEAKKYSNYVFHFILGLMNPDKEIIKKLATDSSNILLHENVTNMSELMYLCDVAISASGSTLYELCSTQTPTITYILADNQIPLALGFHNKGIIQNDGDIRTIGKQTLAKTLIKDAVNLADNYVERIRVSNIMSTIVDGNGAKRIIESIC